MSFFASSVDKSVDITPYVCITLRVCENVPYCPDLMFLPV